MNRPITLVTERDLQGQNPLFPSSDYYREFILMNLYPDGIWLVDKQHSKFSEIKDAALLVAKTFGDTETIEKLNNLDLEVQNGN